jgi:hypothetical protein
LTPTIDPCQLKMAARLWSPPLPSLLYYFLFLFAAARMRVQL